MKTVIRPMSTVPACIPSSACCSEPSPEFGKRSTLTWPLVSSLARFTKCVAPLPTWVSSDVVQVSRRVIGGPGALVCATTGGAVGPTSAIAPSTSRVAASVGLFHRVIERSSPVSGLEVG